MMRERERTATHVPLPVFRDTVNLYYLTRKYVTAVRKRDSTLQYSGLSDNRQCITQEKDRETVQFFLLDSF